MMGTRRSWLKILGDVIQFLGLCLRSRRSVAAENLFLRMQLAFYQERKVKPRRADNPTRLILVLLSRWLNWQDALIVVKPRALITAPVRSPQANSLCERLIGTLRRECLDWMIPLTEGHLRKILASWVAHYSRGRPHSSLGPGIPDPSLGDLPVERCGHRLPVDHQVLATPILGGLHHEYSVQRLAA